MHRKLTKGKGITEALLTYQPLKFSVFAGFLGKIACNSFVRLIDNKTSTYICYHKELFKSLNSSQHTHIIHLPKGNFKIINSYR